MLNISNKLLKLFFIFFSVITGWTSILLFSNTTFNLEIKQLITKMYLNQKDFVVNIKDLSLLLVKDANERFSEASQDKIRLNNAKSD